MGRFHDTQNEAYDYIKKELQQLGWIVKHPSKSPDGQVYNQNQCLDDPEIKKYLEKKHPEYIVKVDESTLWIIEAEPARIKLSRALEDAENYYVSRLNKSTFYRPLFISGVAGNDTDGYAIENKYFENGKFKTVYMNDRKMTGLLSSEITKRILSIDSAAIKDIPIDQSFFLQKADSINEILHKGTIPIEERAKVMAALLLSTLEESFPINTDLITLIKDINTRSEEALYKQGKGEFSQHVKLHIPTSRDNHGKYKKAIVDTLKELYNLNIKSAMNSGADVLGEFYEVFLKYGSWAQKMGIVFTPRHITRFAADILDVNFSDIVYDPTCGTGGFLVAALDRVKNSNSKQQLEIFKQHNIFGIDSQASLVSLAIVNMIFRGDGKNNIIEGDCLTKWLTAATRNGVKTAKYSDKPVNHDSKGITKVLMNPSFHQESFDTREFEFVRHALEQIVHGGILFSVLPVGALLRGGDKYEWRRNDLLANNTLISVITFPPELFYPVGVHTLGIIIKKGIPHPHDQRVLWVKANHDGYVKLKGRRLPNEKEPNDLTTHLHIIRAFAHDQTFPVSNILGVRKHAEIDFSDPELELIPEVYLDSSSPNTNEILDSVDISIRNAAAFLVQNNVAKYVYESKDQNGSKKQNRICFKNDLPRKTAAKTRFEVFKVTPTLFDIIRGDFHAISKLESGDVPTVSRIEDNNGVAGYYKKPTGANIYPPLRLTVSTVTGDTFVQLVPFMATDNVLILTPKEPLLPTTLFFIQTMINAEKWRCSYGRQVYLEKFSKTKIYLPVKPNGKIDEKYIQSLVECCSYWNLLKPHLDSISLSEYGLGSYV